jgi:hypothetical protein
MKQLALVLVVGVLVVPGGRVLGEDTDGRIRVLEEKIMALSEEVEKLKEAKKEEKEKMDTLAGEVEQMKVFELIPGVGEEGKYGLGPAASKIYGVAKGVSVGGYGEVIGRFFEDDEQFNLSTGTGETKLRDDTDMQKLVMYLGYRFNENILFNSEIEFEHAKTSAGPDTSAGEVAVEFANIDFFTGPRFNIRGGLLLVPMGLINELHEAPTYHGVFRPDTEQFIIPTTWRENGVGIFGEVFPGWDYRLYVMPGLVSNSRNTSGASTAKFTHDSGIRGGRQQGVRSLAEELAYVARLDYAGIPGFLGGASLYTGRALTPAGNGLGDTSTNITLWDLHFKAELKGLELRALYTRGEIDDAREINRRAAIGAASGKSIGEELSGYYIEAAYDALPLFMDTTHYLAPFVRYEVFDTQDGTPEGYLDLEETKRHVTTVGISYKPIPTVNVKMDYQFRDNTFSDQFNLGLSFMF